MPFFYAFLVLAGATGGFFSGLLGIGGGIIMFPLLFYLPPLLGFEAIGVKNITGLTMVQGFFHPFPQSCFLERRGSSTEASLVHSVFLCLFSHSLGHSFLIGFPIHIFSSSSEY